MGGAVGGGGDGLLFVGWILEEIGFGVGLECFVYLGLEINPIFLRQNFREPQKPLQRPLKALIAHRNSIPTVFKTRFRNYELRKQFSLAGERVLAKEETQCF